MAPKSILIEPHYFPTTPYLWAVYHASEVWLDGCSAYQKQSYQTRTSILTSQGARILVVPVTHASKRKEHLADISPSYTTPWARQHLRTLQSAYGRAPYFDELDTFFLPLLLYHYDSLFDLQQAILQKMFLWLDKELSLYALTPSSLHSPPLSCWDLRHQLHPKRSIPHWYPSTLTYQQHQGAPFVPHLSFLDLVAYQGRWKSREQLDAIPPLV